MSETKADLSGPDFAKGVAVSKVADGAMLLGHAHGKAVLLARRGDELFAIGATCTHYGAPLADGMLVGHAERFDHAEIEGQLDANTRNCTITYNCDGRKLAVAIVHRDLEGLRAEVEFERTIAATQ
jgi:hypothetical protein